VFQNFFADSEGLEDYKNWEKRMGGLIGGLKSILDSLHGSLLDRLVLLL